MNPAKENTEDDQKTSLPLTAFKQSNKQTLLFWPYKKSTFPGGDVRYHQSKENHDKNYLLRKYDRRGNENRQQNRRKTRIRKQNRTGDRSASR